MSAIDPNVVETPVPRLGAIASSSRWVCFELQGQRYAIAINKVFEVLSSVDIEPVPTAPTGVLGVINLRGSIVTVMDLRHWLAFSPVREVGCVLIANHEGQPVGFCVDRIIEVLNLPDNAIEPASAAGSAHFSPGVSGLVNRNGEILTLLEVSRLLPAETDAKALH